MGTKGLHIRSWLQLGALTNINKNYRKMKNLEKTKMILGYVLLGFSVIGVLIALSYQFDLDWFGRDYITFGPWDGGASNTPTFFGLIGVAGAILLASVKNEEKNQSESESKNSEE